MSQVGVSRPSTQMSQQRIGVVLPEIQHPLSRLSQPDNLDVRGVSQQGERPYSLPPSRSGRPLGSEQAYPTRKSFSAFGRENRGDSRKSLVRSSAPAVAIETIPEGVEVTYGDPSATRLPVFGNKAEYGDRMELQSRASTRLSSATTVARIEIDELESILKDRVKNHYHEVRKKFKDNDPEGKGNVSREALCRICVVVTGRPINQSQFFRLLERIGLKEKTIVNFTEFFSKFREIPEKEYPKWMDPVSRQTRVTMNAPQVHAQLREKARQRFLDIGELLPQLNPDGGRRIEQAEFKQMLNKHLFHMEEDEFEKLWKMYDPDMNGTIDGERFLNRLGISWRDTFSTEREKRSAVVRANDGETKPASRAMKRKEIERKQSLNIERWLKNKFREGFFKMKESFETKDPESKGLVSYKDFLEVLAEHGLKLEKSLTATFLSRCGIESRHDGVAYREFLHKFQDRSEQGVTHNVLTNKKHRIHKRPPSPDTQTAQSSLSVIESQLINMFQKDFLHLLGKFQTIDKYKTSVISQEEFQAVMESAFLLELTPEQFKGFLDNVPLDEDGNVRYQQFMAQFDSKGKAKSLFNAKTEKRASPPPIRPSLSPLPQAFNDALDPINEDNGADVLVVMPEDTVRPRSHREIFKIIKDLLSKRYQDVEAAFYDLDEINSNRISQEMMYQLLKRFDLQPEIKRGEIRNLWKTFITNTDKTLDFLQFVRHFGFSLKSAAFPNAKVNPPRRGDSDCLIRSRKLNCASDMLQDSLRSKIDYMWYDLRKEFVDMDPYQTGFVTREEFREVLTELCVHLSDYELNQLTEKFYMEREGRVSYVEFLKPFALRKQVWRHGNDMLSLLTHPQPELPISEVVEPPQKGLAGITSKLRQKVAGDWRNMRRAFKKLDSSNTGYLTLPEFRSVLKLANILLDEDEVYHVMDKFDSDMVGKIPYDKFIEETFDVPPSRRSVHAKHG